MDIRFFHVDAFCDSVFHGNPAAVCLLPDWLPSEQLQLLAMENALPVSVFIVRIDQGYAIRWFTIESELDLCGHGTLAAAYAIFTMLELNCSTMKLYSEKAGVIVIARTGEFFEFTFPTKAMVPIPCEPLLIEALNSTPEAVFQCDQDRLMLLLSSEELVKNATPDIDCLKRLNTRGVILCALSDRVDFVSRTFYPHKIIPEDAVTGASHCYLAPFFAKLLAKSTLTAQQVSKRGGSLWLDVHETTVTIKAQAVLYAEGKITLSINEA